MIELVIGMILGIALGFYAGVVLQKKFKECAKKEGFSIKETKGGEK